MISAIRITVIHDAENLGLVPVYEAISGKESTMEQELDICNRVYEIATYNTRRVCVTIKKYKPPYIQIRPFTAKENEDLKQVAYVNYTLNEILGLVPVLEPYSDKNSTMKQKLANYHAVYDVAKYKKRRVCVTVKKYRVNKPPNLHCKGERRLEASCLCQLYFERTQRTHPSLGIFLYVVC